MMKNDILKIIVAGLILTSCTSQRIMNAEPVKLVSSEKINHSTNWLVCVESKSGVRYTFKHNSHCWNCEAVNIYENWNRIIYKNGESFFEPVK